MVFRTGFLLALGLVLGVAACAPAGGEAVERARRGPITLEEIQGARVSGTAYELVQRLRPEWLVIRGRQASPDEGIVVYVNDQRVGRTAFALREVSVQDVRQIEKLDARIATNRFGPGHLHGAILVTTR